MFARAELEPSGEECAPAEESVGAQAHESASAAGVRRRVRALGEDEAQRRAYVERVLELTNRHYLLWGALKLLLDWLRSEQLHVLEQFETSSLAHLWRYLTFRYHYLLIDGDTSNSRTPLHSYLSLLSCSSLVSILQYIVCRDTVLVQCTLYVNRRLDKLLALLPPFEQLAAHLAAQHARCDGSLAPGVGLGARRSRLKAEQLELLAQQAALCASTRSKSAQSFAQWLAFTQRVPLFEDMYVRHMPPLDEAQRSLDFALVPLCSSDVVLQVRDLVPTPLVHQRALTCQELFSQSHFAVHSAWHVFVFVTRIVPPDEESRCSRRREHETTCSTRRRWSSRIDAYINLPGAERGAPLHSAPVRIYGSEQPSRGLRDGPRARPAH